LCYALAGVTVDHYANFNSRRQSRAFAAQEIALLRRTVIFRRAPVITQRNLPKCLGEQIFDKLYGLLQETVALLHPPTNSNQITRGDYL
jgi:hypothetical protein